MEKTNSRVILVPCETYDAEVVYEAVKTGVGLLGGIKQFSDREETVLLKPNLLKRADPDRAVTTHPAVFRAVCRLLHEADYRSVTYGDSPGTGSAVKTAEFCGLQPIAAEFGVTDADFSTAVTVPYPEGRAATHFFLAKAAADSPAIINLCKMKTHALERVTGAVKNMYGCVQGINKGMGHVSFPNAESFAVMLSDLTGLLKPRLHIMDGVVAMEGNGPASGTPVKMGVLLFSVDPVALDSVFCRLIHLDPTLVPTNIEGEKGGIGTYRENGIEVVTPAGVIPMEGCVKKYGKADFKAWREAENPKFLTPLSKFTKSRPVIEKHRCIGCGLCVEACPVKGGAVHQKQKGAAPQYDYKQCIRCYCCQELCPKEAIYVRRPLLAKLTDRKW